MKLLQTTCAIVIHSPGMSSFAAAAASGFALSLRCYVFHLNARIVTLEKQLQTPR